MPETVGRLVLTIEPLATAPVVALTAVADTYPTRSAVTRTESLLPTSAGTAVYVAPAAPVIAEPSRRHC